MKTKQVAETRSIIHAEYEKANLIMDYRFYVNS